MRTFLIYAVCIFSLGIMPPPAHSKSSGGPVGHSGKRSLKAKLSEVRKNIREKKREIELSKKRASKILNEIDRLDQQSSRIQSGIASLEAQRGQLVKGINTSQARIASLAADTAAKRRVIKKRLIALFKLQQIGYLKVLLASDSPVDMEKRYTFINDIVAHDEREIQGYLSQENELVSLHDSYIAQESQLDVLTATLRGQNSALQGTRSRKAEMLADIRHSTAATREILTVLQASEEALQRSIRSLEESSGESTGFAAMRGRLMPPVRGHIEDIFGKTTSSMISSKGILFRIRSDTDVRAVYDGRIVWTQWLKGYGNTVIIDHGSRYFTIYAHLGDIGVKVGDRVKSGETIGKSGDAGLSTERTLYFEIRHGENALDPEVWLHTR